MSTIKDMAKLAERVPESAAALGFVIHEQPDYGRAYERAKDAIGGFPGMWQLAAEAARVYDA